MRADTSKRRTTKHLILFALLSAALALAPGLATAQKLVPLAQPADFQQLVGWGIAHSANFTDSALEIEVGKLGERDAAMSYFPKLDIHFRYYLSTTLENSRQYSLVFQSSGVNPLKAYFSVEAAEMVTDLAVQEHLKQVERNVQVIAETILALSGLEEAAKIKAMDLDLAKQRVKYAKNARQDTPEALIETEVARQEVTVAQSQLQQIEFRRQEYHDALKLLLNLPLDYKLEIDLDQARKQLLEGFDPRAVSIKDALDHSYNLKTSRLYTQLQKKRISLAYSRYMPDFYLGVQTEDPLYNTGRENDWFLYLGLSATLWDNMDRKRDVDRQTIRARRSSSNLKREEAKTVRNWRKAHLSLAISQADLKVAREQTRLEAFKEKQELARFRSNLINYAVLAAQGSKHLEARGTEVYRTVSHDKALVDLAVKSGWMMRRFVGGTSVK